MRASLISRSIKRPRVKFQQKRTVCAGVQKRVSTKKGHVVMGVEAKERISPSSAVANVPVAKRFEGIEARKKIGLPGENILIFMRVATSGLIFGR